MVPMAEWSDVSNWLQKHTVSYLGILLRWSGRPLGERTQLCGFVQSLP